MKIKIWTLTTDTQENGFEQTAFATEQERDAAAWAMIHDLYKKGGFSEGDEPDPETSGIADVWDWVRADDLDSLWVEELEIELPAPAGVNADYIALADALHTGQQADIWYDAKAHGDEDVNNLIDETQEAMHKASVALRTLASTPPPVGVNAELLAALKAIRARAHGEFDCPELMAKGPLSDLVSDVAAYATDAIAAAEAGQVEQSKPVRIGIVVDGGIIQEVFADGPAPQVYVIDYDVDGTADDIMDVPQGGDKAAPACINVWTPDASNADAAETLDAIDAWDQSSPELSPLKAVLKRQAAEMDTSIGGKGGVS